MDQLVLRKWKEGNKCWLCGKMEDANHVLFQCVMVKFAWSCIREILQWESDSESPDDLHLGWLDNRGANEYHIGLFSFTAFA